MKPLILAAAWIVPLAAIGAPIGVLHFTAPQQPWTSADGQLHLLRPSIAQPSSSQQPLGALMTQGWRLNWGGQHDVPGTVAVRLTLPVRPASSQGQVTEVLQIGWSAAPEAVRSCLSFGLDGGNRKRLPMRRLNGVTFTAVSNEDAGMSQSIRATDLRSVVGDRCYAVERFTYTVSAAAPDPSVTLLQTQGTSMLDAALSSLLIGSGRSLDVPHVATPAGAVAR